MNTIELENRYKVIKIKSEGEFKTIDLWLEEKDFVKTIFEKRQYKRCFQ